MLFKNVMKKIKENPEKRQELLKILIEAGLLKDTRAVRVNKISLGAFNALGANNTKIIIKGA